MRVYLSANRMVLSVLCCAYAFTFVSISDLPWSLYMLSLVFCTAALSLYTLCNLDIVLMRRYRAVNVLSFVYASSALLSVYLNGQLTPYMLLVFLMRVSLLPFVEVQREKGHVLFLCKVMALLLLVLVMANDVLMVIMPGRFYGDGISKTFLLGNKFATSYDHMILLLMVCLLYGGKTAARRLLPLLFVVVCVVCRYMDCNTAVMGTAAFAIVSYAPDGVKRILSKRQTVLVALVLCALFIYSESVFQIAPIKYFITEILGREITLTGRAQIYEVLGKVIHAHPWIGYGNSAEVIYRYTGAYNAQNGFFDLVVQNGIPSALLYVTLIVALARSVETKESAYLLGIIYGYFLMSTVEVTFGMDLTLFCILLFSDFHGYRENPVTIVEWGRG